MREAVIRTGTAPNHVAPVYVEERVAFVVRTLRHRSFTSAVDLGSRSNSVLPSLTAHRKVCIDLHDFSGGTEVGHDEVERVCHDLEEALPFPDRCFSLVLCMDVLEHVDKKRFVCTEMLRVACGTIIITLPNTQRISYIVGLFRGNLSKQYRFNIPDGSDRHKWVPVYSDSRDFIAEAFDGCDCQIIDLYGSGMLSRVMRAVDPWLPAALRRWTRRLLVTNQVWIIEQKQGDIAMESAMYDGKV